MRVLVISDTHGREENLEAVLKQIGPLDYVIHLGDSEGGEERIREMAPCPVYMVNGNCDYFSELPDSAVVKLCGHRILITHGHQYFVSAGLRELIREARAHKCDIAMFGHTHRPCFDESDAHVIVVNPGSLSFPRQDGRKPSYMILDMDEHGTTVFEQKFL